jgi:hypothetical protein
VVSNAPVGKIHDNRDRHRFELDLDDGTIAIAEYNLLRGKIVFRTLRFRRRMRVRESARR